MTSKGGVHYLKSSFASLMKRQIENTSQMELNTSFDTFAQSGSQFIESADSPPLLEEKEDIQDDVLDSSTLQKIASEHSHRQNSVIMIYAALIFFVVFSKIFF